MPRTGMLQDFGLLGSNVRIDDPMWPAVREAARRILRLEALTICAPLECIPQLDALILRMGDAQPSRLTFPMVKPHEQRSIDVSLLAPEDDLRGHVVRLGQHEPEPNTCWIPMDVTESWTVVLEACIELLAAGYPGCIGCGGPNSERPWNEQKSRNIWATK